jgi:cyclase
MTSARLVARLDVKGPNVIKGINLEGLRVVGQPSEMARRYYADGIDELIYMDAVASLYDRNSLFDIISETARGVFIPMTVGGGIRSLDDARNILRAGADKVAVNTAAIRDPALISTIARRFGSQCMVISIEAKWVGKHWEAYIENGREPTGLDVIEWATKAVGNGAGEILLTSVDREGTRTGFDVALVKAVTDAVGVPVIASGGMGSVAHLVDVIRHGGANAVAMADVLHYRRITLGAMRHGAAAAGIRTRSYEADA